METIGIDTTNQPNFCALAYNPESIASPLPTVENVILLVIRDAEYGLRFLLHPRLDKVVQAVDMPYIKSLLEDFIERVKLDAAALFEHLCSLSVGVLVAHTVGEQINEHPGIGALALQFVPI